jgi:hypothetical protein
MKHTIESESTLRCGKNQRRDRGKDGERGEGKGQEERMGGAGF